MVALGVSEVQLSIHCERRTSLLRRRLFTPSSSGSPSSWSWTLVVYVVCSCVVCWVVEVVVMGVVGRVLCSSLLLIKPACAVVSQVESLVRSLLSLLVVVGCWYALRSSSHLLAGLPCFRYRFCLADVAGFSFSGSLLGSGGSPSAVSSTLATCPAVGHLPAFLCVCVIILTHRHRWKLYQI